MSEHLANQSPPSTNLTVKDTPEWAKAPFRDFLDSSERLGQLIELSVRGISMVRGVPGLVEALAKADTPANDPDTASRLDDAKKMARLADREIDQGFPVLHSQAMVTLWSMLENAVRLFVARWLEHEPAALHVEAIQRLRVRIGEYESLKGEDRFFYILDMLEREIGASLRVGVSRFESLLEPFGLDGAIDGRIRRDLLELSQVRNVHVHRGGVADRRIVETCPWLALAIGTKVTVHRDSFMRYYEAVHDYVLEVICRVGERFGRDMSVFRRRRAQSKSEDQRVLDGGNENISGLSS